MKCESLNSLHACQPARVACLQASVCFKQSLCQISDTMNALEWRQSENVYSYPTSTVHCVETTEAHKRNRMRGHGGNVVQLGGFLPEVALDFCHFDGQGRKNSIVTIIKNF